MTIIYLYIILSFVEKFLFKALLTCFLTSTRPFFVCAFLGLILKLSKHASSGLILKAEVLFSYLVKKIVFVGFMWLETVFNNWVNKNRLHVIVSPHHRRGEWAHKQRWSLANRVKLNQKLKLTFGREWSYLVWWERGNNYEHIWSLVDCCSPLAWSLFSPVPSSLLGSAVFDSIKFFSVQKRQDCSSGLKCRPQI